MRRALFAAACAAVVGLSVPAAASADVLDVYEDLAARRMSPAPLVPTVVAPVFRPLDRTIAPSPSRRRSGYGIRMVRNASAGTDAIIVLEGGSFKNLKAALRDGRRLGFKAKRTRVRGRHGYLLTRRLGPRPQRSLVWVEDGLVYTLAASTSRKVSLERLRATAAALDHLGREYIGAPDDPNNSSEGFAVTTQRTVTTRVSWEAQCVQSDGSPAGIYVGSARATLIPRSGNAFSFDIARHRTDANPWNGTVSGTVSPTAIDLTIQASGTIEGYTCDTGSLLFALDRHG